MARVFVSVGSNVNKEANIRTALAALRRRFGELTLSTVYETQAVGFDGEDFHNLVAGFETGLSPARVAAVLRRIEAAHGRRRDARRYGPRTLDLDLLMYDDLVLEQDGLRLPRDEIIRYAFVLGPLAEVAGDRIHPELGRPLRELWREMRVEPHLLRPVEDS